LRLRSGRISPADTGMSPSRRFPFKPAAAVLPAAEPDHHLVHTAILSISLREQSRGFPRQSVRFLASFASRVSNSNNALIPASIHASDPLSTIPTQGRLRCSQHTKYRITGLIPDRSRMRSHPSYAGGTKPTAFGVHDLHFFHKSGSPR
jgi:hypothetical protein